MTRALPFILVILLFEAVSFAIGRATQGDVDHWYAALARPPFTPPNIAFPVMWTILYALIAAAGLVLWRGRGKPGDRARLYLFGLYMAFNWSWSFIFFGLHMIGPALAWIAVIDVLAAALILSSWKQERTVALLMVPPLLWTLYAAYLNAGYWLLN